MSCRTAGLAVALGMLSSLPAGAAPPQINGTTPFGTQKGVATEVTIAGANLAGNTRLVAPFAFKVAPVEGAKPDAASWKFKLDVPTETPLGVYPIRVQTDEGLSNPFLFTVGQLPQVAEKEDNSSFETAQVVPTPAVIEGQTAGSDVDFFRFAGKKGQRIVVDAQCARIGSGVDPTIRLTTIGRTFVAAAEDSPGLLTDARVVVVLPEDTEYVIELSDARYQGGGRPVYRLVVGAVPAAEEVFPIGGRRGESVGLELRGGTLPDMRTVATTVNPALGFDSFPFRATNQTIGLAAPGEPVLDVESLGPLLVSDAPELRELADPAAPPLRATPPVVLNGRIDPPGDEDRFILTVTPGQKLRIEVEAAENGSALDGVLQVLGANAAVLASADDTTTPNPKAKNPKATGLISPDPTLDFTVPANTTEITLALRDLSGRGGIGFPYRIQVEPAAATFELALTDAQIAIPKGGQAAVGVAVVRKGYTGPITLTIASPPPGLTVRPGTVAEGQLVGAFTVAAASDAPSDPVYLNVVGQAAGPAGALVARASKTIVFAEQAGGLAAQKVTLPTKTVVQEGLAAATIGPVGLRFEPPEAPVEVVHGYGGSVPIKVAALKEGTTTPALTITPLPLPPGLTLAELKLAEKAVEAEAKFTVAVEAPLGAMTVALLAKGKIDNAEQTVALPAFTLNVVRPAALELAAPAIEIKAGATIELKGKVVRKGAFKEPVTVKVNGLPAGLKADPVTVAPDAAEFTVKVVAEPKAAPATAAASVALAFQVNKKDYPAPTAPLNVKVLPEK